MRLTSLRALAALVVAGIAAGCADAPTAPDIQGAGSSPAATKHQTGVPDPKANGLPVEVALYCEYQGGGAHHCYAYANGGDIPYSFTWSGAQPDVDWIPGDGDSSAVAQCTNDPYTYGTPITVTVTVTDGTTSASKSETRSCYWGGW